MRVKSNNNVYFHQALAIAHAFPPYNKLTKKELQVLGEIMRYSHQGYKPAVNEQTRKLIPEMLEISNDSFKNILSSIRNKGLLVHNDVPEKYAIKYLQSFNFEFYEEV